MDSLEEEIQCVREMIFSIINYKQHTKQNQNEVSLCPHNESYDLPNTMTGTIRHKEKLKNLFIAGLECEKVQPPWKGVSWFL